MEDNEIIRLLWERSEHAILGVSEKYGGLVRQIATNILANEEDVAESMNDTWLGLWNAIPPARPQKLMPYICRIARNISLKRHRENTAARRDSRASVPIDELEGCLPGPSMEDIWSARELGRSINRFLETVEPENRVIFIKRYWFSDSVSEIAGAMKMSENHISVRLFRTKKKLKQYLAKEGIEV